MKDFLQKALRITKDLEGYSKAFSYAALYEGPEIVYNQGTWLTEKIEEILPELKEMIAYMGNKVKEKENRCSQNIVRQHISNHPTI